jgi:3,4-dihydroxy 2-butanone 4-phosphate synthase/GTP cyclohydrolase II
MTLENYLLDDLVHSLLKDAAVYAKEEGRPIVTISYAQSLDGSIAIRRGQATAISGAESLKMTHRLRAAQDAILVGIGTVQADDPQLTVREVEGKNPQVVVLDSELRFPLKARLLELEAKPWIFCTRSASKEAQLELEQVGARVFRVGTKDDERVDLRAVLEQLAEMNIASLMVEGGARVIASFFDRGLADQVAITISPIFIGGLKVIERPINSGDGGKFPRVADPKIERLGDDYVLWGKMRGAGE